LRWQSSQLLCGVTTYDPRSIANFFIEAAAKEGKQLRAPQLMALVYIAHGWYLGLTGSPLINEAPEAWEIGPVIPTLYNALKIYGNDPIRERISKPNPSASSESVVSAREYPPPAESDVLKFLNGVWQAYGTFSDSELSTLTTTAGTPWHKTWSEQGASYSNGVDIPEAVIQDHYRTLNVNVIPQGVQATATTDSRGK
jgi:uncharacterized phage-associated protein